MAATRLSAERTEPPASVIVRAPSRGVYDSLWRVAARSLGDGRRWPEIFELNRGMPQPHGRAFTRPSLVYPGQELRLPGPDPSLDPGSAATGDATPGTAAPAPGHGMPPTSPPRLPVPAEPAERPPSADGAAPWSFDPALVGAALAAAGGALLVEALRRARRRYVPGSGDRQDLQRGPVVRELRIRHLRDQGDAPGSDDDQILDDSDETVEVPPGEPEGASADPPAQDWQEDARDVALTLATARGLGLIGEGALGACRALLVTVVAGARHTEESPVVVVTTSCLRALVGPVEPSDLPTTVLVVEDLADARDAVEQEVLRRTGGERAGDRRQPLALVAEVPAADDPDLQSVLDNGAQVGIVGLLLGQWLAGVTAYVGADGIVSATSPGLGEHLRGAHLFAVDPVEAATLLDLLQDADPRQFPALLVDVLELAHDDDADFDPDDEIGAELVGPAQDETATVEPLGVRPVEIRVFGPPQVLLHGVPAGVGAVDITSRLQPRVREMLVFLALRPAGATREAVAAALWPDSPPERIGNAMNTSLSRLRRAIESETAGALSQIVRTSDNLLRLDADLVGTDFEEFDAAVRARRVATSHETRADADQAVVDSYGGSLAEGMSTEWIETARAGIQRDALDAVAALARVLVADDPRRTLDLLEIARAFEPHNEHVYRDIMRLQARLGQPDGVARTMALLTSRLAEIDDGPSPETAELARRLTSGEQPAQPRGQAPAHA